MKTRVELSHAIQLYETSNPQEANFIPRFVKLLAHPQSFQRNHLPGHITGSAWIVDESGAYALLTHHAKLDRWLQPGGHSDGDEDITRVCMKEALEETGLQSLKLWSDTIFDIDIHTIPSRNDFPEHQHYDVRLLFTAAMHERFVISQESLDLAWVSLDELASKTRNNTSMLRMSEKTKKLFGRNQK